MANFTYFYFLIKSKLLIILNFAFFMAIRIFNYYLKTISQVLIIFIYFLEYLLSDFKINQVMLNFPIPLNYLFIQFDYFLDTILLSSSIFI